jgi:hypothetical protein
VNHESRIASLERQISSKLSRRGNRLLVWLVLAASLVLVLSLVGCAGRQEVEITQNGVKLSNAGLNQQVGAEFVCNIFNSDGSPLAQVGLRSNSSADEQAVALGSQAIASLASLAAAANPRPRSQARSTLLTQLAPACTPWRPVIFDASGRLEATEEEAASAPAAPPQSLVPGDGTSPEVENE